MIKSTFAFVMAGALLAGGLAAPAFALVDDRPNAISSAAESDLQRELDKLGPHRFDVVFVERAVGSPGRMANTEFNRRKLGPKDGLILIAVRSKQVGVHVGAAFEQRGVAGPVVAQQIKASFLPAAKRGNYAQAATDLARGLIAAGASGSPVSNSNRRVRQSDTVSNLDDEPVRRRGGFPWGLILVVAIGGVGVWYFLNKQKGSNVEGRLAALRDAQETIMTGALKLGEVDQLGRFHEGEAAAAYQSLAKRAAKLLKKATWFGNRFHDAEKALAARKPGEAEPILDELEREVTALEAAIAAAVSALDQLETGATPSAEALAQVDLPEQVEAVARELQVVQDTYTQALDRARRLNFGPDAMIEGRLAAAKRHLTESPLDVKAAKRALQEAMQGIEQYRGRLEAEADREVEREAYQNQHRGNDAAWIAASVAPSVFSHMGHEHPHDHGHHEQSTWDSGSDNSWGSSSDDGATAEGSWGSDSSSDLSGSSSDDNSGSW